MGDYAFAAVRTEFVRAVAKSGVDIGLHAPLVNVPTFFLWMSYTQGKSWQETCDRFGNSYIRTVVSAWGLWFPAQIITFGLVPPELRILWVKSVGLVWTAILSINASKKTTDSAHSRTCRSELVQRERTVFS